MATTDNTLHVVFANDYTDADGTRYQQGRHYKLPRPLGRHLLTRSKVRLYDEKRDKDVKRGSRDEDGDAEEGTRPSAEVARTTNTSTAKTGAGKSGS